MSDDDDDYELDLSGGIPGMAGGGIPGMAGKKKPPAPQPASASADEDEDDFEGEFGDEGGFGAENEFEAAEDEDEDESETESPTTETESETEAPTTESESEAPTTESESESESEAPTTESEAPTTETESESPTSESPTAETPTTEPEPPTLEPRGPRSEPQPGSAPRPLPVPVGAPPREPLTRLIGLAWLLLFGALGALLVERVYATDFGTTNERVLSVIRLAAVVVPGYPALLGLIAFLTGRRPSRKLNPFGLPCEGWWFAGLAALTGRELKRVFFHPVAYVLLFVFLVFNGIMMLLLIDYYSSYQAANIRQPASYYLTNNFMLWLSLVLICPGLTMRLIAEERQVKSLEMLLTAPVTESQVVLSKFLCTVGYYVFMVGMSLCYVFLLRSYAAEWDWGPILGGYVGLLLVGCFFCAIGVFASSLTRSQIVAYMLAALVLIVVAVLIQFIPKRGLSPAVKQVMAYLSVTSHQNEMASGILPWRSFVFFGTNTVFFLYLAARGLAAQSWR